MNKIKLVTEKGDELVKEGVRFRGISKGKVPTNSPSQVLCFVVFGYFLKTIQIDFIV